MCNILFLKPGVMPKRDDFWNMCYNNWHSYGLVTLVDGKMDIKKFVPDVHVGEIDPKELWDLLVRDKEYPRFVHVRHNTAGATSEENCHPFDVFYQQKGGKEHQVVFMHNGTLYEYKSKKLNDNNVLIDDESGPSDTLNFTNRVLIPFMSSCDFGQGKADLDSPYMRKLLLKFWPTTGNRGLLIANDQEPFFLGDWKKTKGENDEEIITANDDYFKAVVRGPEKMRRDAAEAFKKKQEEEARKNVVPFRQGITENKIHNISDFTCFTTGAQHPVYGLTSSLKDVLSDWEVWDRHTAVGLGAATADELEEIWKEKKDCLILMDWIFSDYATLYGEFLEIEEKKKRASQYISELVQENEHLRGLLNDVKQDVA